MKTRTFNLLLVLLVALGMMASFTACEEKGDEPENQSIIGIWQEVFETSEWGDGTLEYTEIRNLFAFQFEEGNQATLYATYYEGEVDIKQGSYTYDAGTGVLALSLPGAELIAQTFACKVEGDNLILTFEAEGYRNIATFQRISNEELHEKINETTTQK